MDLNLGKHVPDIVTGEFIISVETLSEIFHGYACKLSMDGQFRGVRPDDAYAPAYIFK